MPSASLHPAGGAAPAGQAADDGPVELTAWLQLLAFTNQPARRWEPKRLRLRIFSIAARLADRSGRGFDPGGVEVLGVGDREVLDSVIMVPDQARDRVRCKAVTELLDLADRPQSRQT